MTEFEKFKRGVQAVLSVPPSEAQRIREEYPMTRREKLRARLRKIKKVRRRSA